MFGEQRCDRKHFARSHFWSIAFWTIVAPPNWVEKSFSWCWAQWLFILVKFPLWSQKLIVDQPCPPEFCKACSSKEFLGQLLTNSVTPTCQYTAAFLSRGPRPITFLNHGKTPSLKAIKHRQPPTAIQQPSKARAQRLPQSPGFQLSFRTYHDNITKHRLSF